ncbi:TPM domain-containing protein [Roseateles violae]|uniref:TPM domain-containing protein n=1 Tax=Roseateles violae TaxID=3058042 RepID=A0ABT8DTI0_9BURK|nr:TPM domain-containing protein [Pelomonas sp. PFR6]MDN3919619.1 TPM domain-containing protein [Pelomonas sp. PFR6]
MGRLARLLKHRLWDEADARRALPADALQRLQQRVADSEAHHSGEIRVCVEASLPLSYLWRGASARERALAIFGKLRVWDTEQNNGVLIYLLLAEHAIEIVADRGLDRRIAAGDWQALVARLGEALRAGRFEQGLAEAIDAIDAPLRAHFPLESGATNPDELPDAVVLL